MFASKAQFEKSILEIAVHAENAYDPIEDNCWQFVNVTVVSDVH